LQRQRAPESAAVILFRVPVAPITTLTRKADAPRDGFQKGGFPRAILTHQEGDGRIEAEVQPGRENGDVEGETAANCLVFTKGHPGEESASGSRHRVSIHMSATTVPAAARLLGRAHGRPRHQGYAGL